MLFFCRSEDVHHFSTFPFSFLLTGVKLYCILFRLAASPTAWGPLSRQLPNNKIEAVLPRVWGPLSRKLHYSNEVEAASPGYWGPLSRKLLHSAVVEVASLTGVP